MLNLTFILLCLLSGAFLAFSIQVDSTNGNIDANGLPILYDDDLKVEKIFEGIEHPTSFAFMDPNYILIVEKDTGKVKRLLNFSTNSVLLDVGVATERERGLLGVAVTNSNPVDTTEKYIFIYLTESKTSTDSTDKCPPPEPYYCDKEGEPLGNRLYRYELDDNQLINGKLLLDLPAKPGPNHNGGRILIGPDDAIYVTIGDLLAYYNSDAITEAINIKSAQDPDGRSGILRITQDGNPVGKGILGKEYPLNLYYAYGIRNSFGMDFDPVTGNLWDTENGPAFGDEINLVEPGFNSGWAKVQGIWKPRGMERSESMLDLLPGDTFVSKRESLINFDSKGNYSSPEFTWKHPVGVTALKFLYSDNLGKKYENDMFVGDTKHGRLYHFDLNKDRTELVLPAQLRDKIANTDQEIDQSGILFGRGFGGITDIEVGPDGYLYVLSYRNGSLYRIVPVNNT